MTNASETYHLTGAELDTLVSRNLAVIRAARAEDERRRADERIAEIARRAYGGNPDALTRGERLRRFNRETVRSLRQAA